MEQVKVVRKGSYQGVPQWGISTSAEMTPSKATARKWAELENAARRPRIGTCPKCGSVLSAVTFTCVMGKYCKGESR